MKFDHVHHLSPVDRELFRGIFGMLSIIHEDQMTVSAEVKAALDLVRQNTSMVTSVDAGMKALSLQVSQLQDQIANQSPSLSADDKLALAEMATDLQGSISTLQGDIPANTTTVSSPVTAPAQPAAPGTSTSS